MGWIEQHFQRNKSAAASPDEARFESGEQEVWEQICRGLERDVDDFKQHGGGASLQHSGDTCRVTSSTSHTTVVLSADPEAHVIRYDYQPEGSRTAVPEGGILSLRAVERGVQIYSADQQLSSEQARQLVLEPLFFPQAPEGAAPAENAP